MRLATVLTPMSDRNLTLASQSGVTDLTIRYADSELADLLDAKRRVEAFGMRLSVMEGYLPMENVKRGNNHREADVERMARLVRDLGTAGIPLLCYNFMAGTDWVRTRTDVAERGGALVTAFDVKEAEKAVSLDESCRPLEFERISTEQLWDNLEWFLKRILPVAEASGVTLVMHPDDPPLDEFLGRSRIMNCVESFERLVGMAPSPSNAICFCQGTFAEMGVDIPQTIRRLGSHIRFVHFRDVVGTRENFRETFHDNGKTDMVAAMQAYREIGFDGPLRPDHVPQLDGEEDGDPGYTMLGRLYAFGYIRGLMQSAGWD